MRGTDSKQEGMFSYVSPEARVPTNHPLRPIRAMVSEALEQMDRKLEKLYSQTGRPSIAPERLIRATAGAGSRGRRTAKKRVATKPTGAPGGDVSTPKPGAATARRCVAASKCVTNQADKGGDPLGIRASCHRVA